MQKYYSIPNAKDDCNMYTIISQECSRRAMTWNRINMDIGDTTYINPIKEFIEPDSNTSLRVWLAGGAVIDILQNRKPNDYDLFFVGEANDIVEYITNIKKQYEYFETANALSIEISGNKIQFIKRAYSDIMHVIGGFDFDASRLAYCVKNNTVITTTTGYLAYQHTTIFVNPYCLSTSFYHRIYKYTSMKNYKIHSCHAGMARAIYSVFKRRISFVSDYTTNSSLKYSKTTLLDQSYDSKLYYNYIGLIKNNYNYLTSSGVKYEIEDFIKIAQLCISKYLKEEELKEKYNLIKFAPRIKNHLPPNLWINAEKVYYYYVLDDSSRRGFNIEIDVDPNSELMALIKKTLIERYHHYEAVTGIRIVAPSSQFSGTLNPVIKPLNKIFRCYIKRDFLFHIPQITTIFTALKILRIPRPIRYSIVLHYIDSKIFDTLNM